MGTKFTNCPWDRTGTLQPSTRSLRPTLRTDQREGCDQGIKKRGERTHSTGTGNMCIHTCTGMCTIHICTSMHAHWHTCIRCRHCVHTYTQEHLYINRHTHIPQSRSSQSSMTNTTAHSTQGLEKFRSSGPPKTCRIKYLGGGAGQFVPNKLSG